MLLIEFNKSKHCAAAKTIILDMKVVRDHYQMSEGTMFEMTPTVYKMEAAAKDSVKAQHNKPQRRGFIVPSTFSVETNYETKLVEIFKNDPKNEKPKFTILQITL